MGRDPAPQLSRWPASRLAHAAPGRRRALTAAVTVVDLDKVYRVYGRPIDRVREALTGRPAHRAHHALTGISFEVRRGDGFGVVGENGAGKSTLLRILAGITPPTRGRAMVHGTVASILELGWGFQPQLTGRQNIALGAALLGLSAAEVRERTPAIVDFAELGAAIDEPVRGYSTGMAMRLAFATAVQVEPDVLIVDEALSVGDGYFQRKCVQRVQAFRAAGGTLVLSSHAMFHVAEFCSQALWLRDGRVAAVGAAATVIDDYEAFLTAKVRDTLDAGPDPVRTASPARIVAVGQAGAAGPLAPGDDWWIEIACAVDDPALGLHVAVGVDRADGVQVFACSTRDDGQPPRTGRGEHRMRLEVPALPLIKGRFTIYVFLLDDTGVHVYDRRVLPDALAVAGPDWRAGLVSVPHQWR